MKKNVSLNTKRLIIKTLKTGHINHKYVEGLNDPEINKYLVSARLKKQDYGTVRKFVKFNLDSKDSLLLGIFSKKDKRLIGTLRLHDILEFHRLCHLGICVFDKDYWHRGYALEALKRAVRFAFEDLKLHYVEAGVYKENTPSVRLFKRAGFRAMASFKDKYRHIDRFKEVLMFGKTNKRFKHHTLK